MKHVFELAQIRKWLQIWQKYLMLCKIVICFLRVKDWLVLKCFSSSRLHLTWRIPGKVGLRCFFFSTPGLARTYWCFWAATHGCLTLNSQWAKHDPFITTRLQIRYVVLDVQSDKRQNAPAQYNCTSKYGLGEHPTSSPQVPQSETRIVIYRVLS